MGRNPKPETRSLQAPWFVRIAAGVLLLATIVLVQIALYTRLVSAHQTRVAEAWPEGAKDLQKQLEKARAADPTNGWAIWLLSKEMLRQAVEARARANRLASTADEALATGNNRAASQLRLAEEAQRRKHDELLNEAERLAEEGTSCFNSIGCYKQMASIYFRQAQTEDGKQYVEDAERQLQTVARIKPNDIESIEWLGLFKLRAEEWDELETLTELILRRHPYSANAYFYRAVLAKERRDTEALFFNVRQAYMMMIQETGPIFFDRGQLETLAITMGVVDRSSLEKHRP